MLGWDLDGDALVAPAVARNRDVILQVLKRVLPPSGLVLEIASGSGEHAVHFAGALPALRWQPSDPEPAALRSIAAYARAAGLPNLLPPVRLDAGAADWPVDRADTVLAINLIHIAPWSVTEGLMAGAGRRLPAGGLLVLYGPFMVDGAHTARSNADFDADLRNRDPRWGVREVEAVATVGAAQGLRLTERVAMPANNLSLLFRRS
ncbi:DUF938 domain-containing protein [Methylobacterium haplocladii]|uniref:SAM-dependent methyltransferase n=1 Tax=Methylobacterium haplocladii TaxID=1176176 RepID=A0A512ITY7_9HYPH|nr:DUF938 domain-containing protein [Methylobacterium haplocladii]GEP01099.1 SAM-dependent methyltransferase [Methylobacterium haplocladii]GJD85244.1 hypothetical protein HPGCJGGD_3131 [Methylobacterium haplocladii]GLS60024.1 SAM-dependent methyltransferase [Methylobacterium haplocladii]